MVGVNYYPHNQWYFEGPTIPMGHHEHRALSDMLVEAFERYGKPLMVAETGAEGSGRPAWLHYVCDEVRAGHGARRPPRGDLPLSDHRLRRMGQRAPLRRGPVLGRGRRRPAPIFAPLVAELERQMAHPAFRERPAEDILHEADRLEQRFGEQALAVVWARLAHAERFGSRRLPRRRAVLHELMQRRAAGAEAPAPVGDQLRWATF